MFCSLYNNMKRSRNISRFHSKQTCMSMWRRPHGQTALGALWWTIFDICLRFEHKLPKYPENTLDKIRLRDNVSSLHKICQIWCTVCMKRRQTPRCKNIIRIFNIIFLTFGCWRQWQEPNLTRPAVYSGAEHGWIPSPSSRLKQRKLKDLRDSSISFQTFGPKNLILNLP